MPDGIAVSGVGSVSGQREKCEGAVTIESYKQKRLLLDQTLASPTLATVGEKDDDQDSVSACVEASTAGGGVQKQVRGHRPNLTPTSTHPQAHNVRKAINLSG